MIVLTQQMLAQRKHNILWFVRKGGNKMYSVIVAENEVDLSGDNNIMFEFTAMNEAISFAEQMIKQGKAVEVFKE